MRELFRRQPRFKPVTDEEARESAELLTDAPHVTPVRRLDEVTAARRPNIRYAPAVAG